MNRERGALLQSLPPPPGGWERLEIRLARRGAPPPTRATWVAFAAGIALAVLGLALLREPRHAPLQLPASAARLIDAPATGEAVLLARGGEAQMESTEPGVRLYWVR